MSFKSELLKYICTAARWAEVKFNGKATFHRKHAVITVEINGEKVLVSGQMSLEGVPTQEFQLQFNVDWIDHRVRLDNVRYLSENNVIDTLRYPERLEAIKRAERISFRTSWYDYVVTRKQGLLLVNVRKRSDPHDDPHVGQWLVVSLSRLEQTP